MKPCRHDLEAHARQHKWGWFERLAIAVFAAGWVLTFVLAAFGQDSGEVYHGLRNANGISCCGGHDCAMLAPYALREGPVGYEVFYKDKWLNVPPSAILDIPSWDGRNHACIRDWSATGGDVSVLCLIVDLRA